MTPPRVLHLIREANETAAPYNEHVLCGASVCGAVSYFPPALAGAPSPLLSWGDGSVAGFVRAVRAAVASTGPDVIHAHSPHVGALWAAASVGGSRRIPLVYTVHTSWANISVRNRALLLPVLAGAALVVFCSEASRASMPASVLRLLGARGAVVPNGVALDRLDKVAVEAESRVYRAGVDHDDGFRAVVVGRLMGKKDPWTPLRALAREPELPLRLSYLGRGPLDKALEAEAGRLGLGGRVTFRGVVPREELYRTLAADADLLVSTSRIEGLPLAPIEAMALGVPVVLSDIPPHREIVAGLDDVPLVKTGDDGGLAGILRTLVEGGAERLRARGARGRDHVRSRFGLDLMLRRYGALYDEVVHGR